MLRHAVIPPIAVMIAACGLSVVGVDSSGITPGAVDGAAAETAPPGSDGAVLSGEPPPDAPIERDAPEPLPCTTILADEFDALDTNWVAFGDATWNSGTKAVDLTNGNNAGSITYKQPLAYERTLTVEVDYSVAQYASAGEGLSIGWLTAVNTKSGGGSLGSGLCGNGTTGVGGTLLYRKELEVASSVDGSCAWGGGQAFTSPFPSQETLRLLGTANDLALQLGAVVHQRIGVSTPKTGHLLLGASNASGSVSKTSITAVRVVSCR